MNPCCRLAEKEGKTTNAAFDPPPGGHFVDLPGGKRLYVMDADEWAAQEIKRAKEGGTR